LLSIAAEQALAADRNQRVSHRQLASSVIVSRPLKRGVRWLLTYMTFILVPSEGEDLQVNAWNWRPTLELLFAANVITEEDHERMGAHGSAGKVDAEKASRIADAVLHKLLSMNAGERMLANLSVSKEPKKLAEFSGVNADDIDENELYSTTYEWLEQFSKFCRSSGGFEVM
jgi:hypothetical protein